ncbi:uncharacterized protein B0H18DRAFT_1116274 [Fomitopsis serialis]|uniref:uncharacterized protein n=1 Tax=Fomitopsis serialis TaxID=139415 RepID=UPI002007F9D0|nr:uncharacterized protein B0H18DRAFT_1116274 [Neoantrodia serialis]KAH9931468.1 hypothetical protein B0H18DRAFT_1116274 [Neoantrodia serialis]
MPSQRTHTSLPVQFGLQYHDPLFGHSSPNASTTIESPHDNQSLLFLDSHSRQNSSSFQTSPASQSIGQASHDSLVSYGNRAHIELYQAYLRQAGELKASQADYASLVNRVGDSLGRLESGEAAGHGAGGSNQIQLRPDATMTLSRSLLAQLDESKYPEVKHWHRSTWAKANKAAKDVADPDRIEGKRGKARLSQGVNVKQQYQELENGTVVNGWRAAATREEAMRTFNDWKAAAALTEAVPSTFSKRSRIQGDYYRAAMYSKFDELRFCALHWKVDQIAKDIYPQWYKNNFGVKRERSDTPEVTDLPSAKKQKVDSDDTAPPGQGRSPSPMIDYTDSEPEPADINKHSVPGDVEPAPQDLPSDVSEPVQLDEPLESNASAGVNTLTPTDICQPLADQQPTSLESSSMPHALNSVISALPNALSAQFPPAVETTQNERDCAVSHSENTADAHPSQPVSGSAAGPPFTLDSSQTTPLAAMLPITRDSSPPALPDSFPIPAGLPPVAPPKAVPNASATTASGDLIVRPSPAQALTKKIVMPLNPLINLPRRPTKPQSQIAARQGAQDSPTSQRQAIASTDPKLAASPPKVSQGKENGGKPAVKKPTTSAPKGSQDNGNGDKAAKPTVSAPKVLQGKEDGDLKPQTSAKKRHRFVRVQADSTTARGLFKIDYFKDHLDAKLTGPQFEAIFRALPANKSKEYAERSKTAEKTKRGCAQGAQLPNDTTLATHEDEDGPGEGQPAEMYEEVVGGSIVLMVETPRTRLQPGTDVEITLPTQQVPSFYGTLRSVIAVNKEWVMFHTRGHLGVDCLLLAPLDSTQISWWYRLRTRLAPDAWLDAFPPGLNHSVTPIPQFAPSRSPSPSTPPETPAPPPSFSLEDANSLLEKTARLIADQREAELRPWLRAGCPGQSVSFAEHVALIREMTEARQTATK